MELKVKKECMVCPTNIWEYNGVKYVKTDAYNETDVKLHDGSRMTIGVCPKHVKVKLQDLPLINQKLQQGWLEEVALGIGDDSWVKQKAHKITAVGAA